ncbi:MAG TPA: cation:proton antiporter [Bryobacteraceae bacterium]|jgi:Kef-type K+ transport system membrane component KefB
MQNADTTELVLQSMMVLGLIIAAAKLGGELLGRLGQPPVLGELLIGVVLGNLNLFGLTLLDPLKTNSILQVVAQFGAILLLFEVGVESDLIQLLAVGWSSLMVATLGVIAPMLLGYVVAMQLLPDAGWLTYLFVGGTLTATSVGITARVLKDLGKANTKEARIILGAAVADDVIGLVVLAVVSGLVSAAMNGTGGGGISWTSVVWIVAKAAVFLTVAVVVGRFWAQRAFVYAAKLRVAGALLAVCICFCFAVATLSGVAGLAPIVGAFAAGVVLEEVHYRPFLERGERRIEELLFPINTLIVPVFFVLMGLRVDLRSFASVRVLGFAALITAVAVIGKQICGLGVLERGVDRIVIGVGMIPRGEVGLIFAGMGSTLMLHGQPVLSQTTYSALVLMIMLTTFLTPPLLKLVFDRKGSGRTAEAGVYPGP